MKQEIQITKIKRPLATLINEKFRSLWNCSDRYIVCYGSRGSSKSIFACVKIVNHLINDDYFKGIAIRKTEKSLRESCFDSMIKVIDMMGLTPLFRINKNPMKITCLQNGNALLFRGMDEPSKIKSISDPCFIWYEEEIPEKEEDWITISTTLRSSKAKYIQELFTINPVIEDYESCWFYKMFFEGSTELEYRKKFEFTNEDGETFTQHATIHHSTYHDNKWLDKNAVAKIELMAQGDPYLYQVYNLGIWANKIIEGRFFSRFDITKHISYQEYDPSKPLHVSFDFNRRPYSAATIYQVYDKEIYCIDEICVLNREIQASPIKQTCNRFKEKYPEHREGIYIYGDPSGRQEDSKTEKGFNDYRIITDELAQYNPLLRVSSSAPSVKKSGEFINSIFENNFNGLTLLINNNCKELKKDLQYLKIDKEGGKLIEKYKDVDEAQVEKYGHTSDTLRYFICWYFDADFTEYKNPNKNAPITPLILSGKKHSRYKW